MNTLVFKLTEDREIIDNFISGDRELAATAFVRKYQKFVYSIAFRYMNNYDDAEDVAQESFIKAIKHLPNFRNESSLKTWLYRITVNNCISLKRKQSISKTLRLYSKNDNNDVGLDIPDNNPSPLKNMENNEMNARLMEGLSKLPEKQRETFAMRFFDDLSYDEISEILGTSIGGLKANYFHATKKLAKYMKEEV